MHSAVVQPWSSPHMPQSREVVRRRSVFHAMRLSDEDDNNHRHGVARCSE